MDGLTVLRKENEMNDKENTKQYIGDSVYAEFNGYEIILTTENGLPFDPSNRIVLEPEVLDSLLKYAARHGWKQP